MRLWFHNLIAKILGRNLDSTPKEIIVDQLNEPRPLPMGRGEFELWSNRIIAGALVQADHRDQKFVLADMLLHLGPTESHKPDAHFIHSLRKFAVNQVADEMRKEIREQRKAEIAAREAELAVQ